MSLVQDQTDRDQEIWREWVDGLSFEEIGRRRGISKQAAHQAKERYLATMPNPERAAYRARQLERYESLYLAHREAALEKPRTAAIVRGILDSQCRILGLVVNQVQHQGQVEHTWQPGPTVAEVLDDWRRRGILKAEITR
jgi:hypothetical protein